MPRAIFTNLKDAYVEYTARVSNPAEFDRMFTDLLAWKLASLIAPSLISGDPYKVVANAERKYLEMRSQHMAQVQNSTQEHPTAESEFISVRL